MGSQLAARPLLKWDGFSLHVDLDLLETVANRELQLRVPAIRHLSLDGEGENLEAEIHLAWKGLPARVKVSLGELRLYRGYLGCRIENLRGPLGLGVPFSLISTLLRKYAEELASFDPNDGILLIDLRRFLPLGIEVRVKSVSCRNRWLEIELAPGTLTSTFTQSLGKKPDLD